MGKDITTLLVGQKYPLSMNQTVGASANFLDKAGAILQITMPDILASEEQPIRKGEVSAGVIVDQPLILFVFKFGDIVLDCPFDARLIKKDLLYLPNIKNEKQRLSFKVHLIDSNSHILHGLRYLTLSPALTFKFLLAVQDQLSLSQSMNEIYQKYLEEPIETIIELAKIAPCG